MSKIVLAAGMCETASVIAYTDYISIGHGAVCYMRQSTAMHEAVGDSDSITRKELAQLKQYCEVGRFPSHKNEIDTEVTVEVVLQLDYDDIILYGGPDGRLDHEMTNLHLMIYREPPSTLMNDTSIIRVLYPGIYEVEKLYTCSSFLSPGDPCISEEGAAYPLGERVLKVMDIYSLPNEVNDSIVRITIHHGRVLMMQCRDA